MPVVVDGVVYVSSQARLYAYDAASGDEKWSNPAWGALASLAFSDGVLYAHASSSSEGGAYLVALDPADGQELWSHPSYDHPGAYPFSSPIVADDLIIVGLSSNLEVSQDLEALTSLKGNVVAFDKDTGEQAWRHFFAEGDESGATVWSSVSVDLDARRVFVSTGNNYYGEDNGNSDSLFAFELDTGEVVWHTQLESGDVWSQISPSGPDNDFGTNPIVYDWEIDGEVRHVLAAGQKSGSFWALDRDDGSMIWENKLGPGNQLTGGILNNGAFDGKRVIAACNDRSARKTRLVGMNPGTGKVDWEREFPAWVWGPITVHNGVGFVPVDTTMHAFDVEDGAELFSYQGDGTISSGAVVADGKVYFGNGTSYFSTTSGSDVNVLQIP
jgi:polyvinyl alcohol dehydrogenase (cytochrome)